MDIDMNAGGRISDSPVENIVFDAPAHGKYVVSVFQNSDKWMVGITVHERYYSFEGHGQRQVCTFTYAGGEDVQQITAGADVQMHSM